MSASAAIYNEESFYTTLLDPLQNATQNRYFRLATGMEAIVPNDSGASSDSCQETVSPQLEITVPPSDKFRFRYKSESGSHGKLRGAAKSRAKTNFPTVKLHNCDLRGPIEIKASLYTNEENPRPHILELVGKNCSDGTCSELLSADKTAVFRYLEIESKKKEELITIISQNKRDLYGEDYDEEEIKKEALNEIKALNMNAARLCFQAFHKSIPVSPQVFSGPIKNLKSASSDLKITRLSLVAGRCSGGEDMILLCDKINKDDIRIRFFEKDENETVLWEDVGVFNKCDVHHQVAIAFKTPSYYQNIEKVVYIELFRPSDNQSGEALKFTYIPDEIDALRFSKKRKIDPSETRMQFQDIMQPSTSSQFMTSPSVSSGTEDILFQGSPGTSSSEEYTYDPTLADLPFNDDPLSIIDMKNILQTCDLVDWNNFAKQLETNQSAIDEQMINFEAGDESNPSCQMDSATELRTVFTNESDRDAPILTNTSMESPNLFEYLLRLGDSVVSYLQDSLPSSPTAAMGHVVAAATRPTAAMGRVVAAAANNRIIKPQTCIAEGQMMAPSNVIDKKNAKRPFAKAQLNVEESVETDNADSSFKGELGDGTNLGNSSKKSENKNFEDFKKSINDILRKRTQGAFMRYIDRLMFVEDENGNLLLHLAVLEQSQNINLIAKFLEIAPQNVNKQNKFKQTPLHLATMTDNLKLIVLLMTRKGSPSIKNQDGNNCFHLAAKSNFINSMKLLLIPSLKERKHIPSLDDLNYDGLSPLHLCIMNNAKECMQLLLRAGANVNIAERKTGRSLLHLALDQHTSLLGPLLSHPDINTDCTDFGGFTPFEAACEARGTYCIQEELMKVAWLCKGNEGSTIKLFLETEIRKLPHKFAAETDDYDSSCSETSSDSDSEEIHNQPTTINHQVNCVQENLNTFDEEKLCKILDANGGWRKLGQFIGCEESVLNDVDILTKGSSPTKCILKKVKSLYPDCDEKTLKNILEMAELKETVHILESLNI